MSADPKWFPVVAQGSNEVFITSQQKYLHRSEKITLLLMLRLCSVWLSKTIVALLLFILLDGDKEHFLW